MKLLKDLIKADKWKSAFFGLALVNLGIILWLLALIFLPTDYTLVNVDRERTNTDAEFTIVSTKDNLEQLTNEYLNELSSQTIFDYSISLDEFVELRGNIRAFDQVIPITVKLAPVVQENGDLILEQQDISLGKLPLPGNKVLEFVKKNYDLPEWVIVNPEEENIYVALTQMETDSNFQLAAERFNLKSDQLAFRIAVPKDSFQLAQQVVTSNDLEISNDTK
ncbi:YpmS family protein [Salimicrobium sp. PL1-032A]|uniref:YpmS family protein n=1 Tax=Salimicrobium sp. PL1-032A TaxID=3095364 RepID=UPI003261A26D